MAKQKLKRDYISFTPSQKIRIQELMKTKEFSTRAELIRHAVEIGLDGLEKKYRSS